ncbi:MAG: hypothetical protein ACLQVK_06745 [Acidimicrobiales bacterium]
MAQSPGDRGVAPPEFVAAVYARLNLMEGTPGAPVQDRATFAQLQFAVGSLVTDPTGTYVDPNTGNPWELPTLLQQSSGRTTWLPQSAGAQALEQQITSVLGAAGWRLAAYPVFQGLQASATSGALAPGCTTDATSGQPQATPAQVQEWQQLFSKAEAGPWTYSGGYIGAQSGASGAGSYVDVGRGVINALLPGPNQTASGMPSPKTTLPWQSGLPVPGVAVDGARVVLEVDAFGTGGSEPGVTSGGAPWDTGGGDITITGGPGVDSANFVPDASYAGPRPGSFGTFFPQRIPGISTGYILLEVPTSFLLQAVPDALYPVFKPATLFQLQAQEPPPGWPSARDLGRACADNQEWLVGDVSDAARPADLGGDPVIYHEAFGPLAPPLMHIGTAALDYSQRQKDLVALLSGLVSSTADAKYSLDTQMAALQQRLAQAVANEQSLQAQAGQLSASLDSTTKFLAQIQVAQDKMPSSVRAELQAQSSLEETVQKLEDQVVSAEQSGASGEAATLAAELRVQQERLATIDKSLAQYDGGTEGLVNRWVQKLRFIQGQIYALRQQQGAAEQERSAASLALQQAEARRTQLDTDLAGYEEELENADFAVNAVTVEADGKVVFKSKLFGNELALQDIDRQIAEAEPLLAQLHDNLKSTEKQWLAAEQVALAALDHVTSTIWSNFAIEAGVITADYAYDVLKGYSQGGPLGALGAAAKKGWENLPNLLSKHEAVVIPDYDHQFSGDLFSNIGKQGKAIAVSRPLKELLSKPLGDGLNKALADGYSKFIQLPGFPRAPFFQGAPGSISALPSIQGAIDKAKTFLKWSDSNEQALRYMRKGPGLNDVNKLAANFVKDFAKAGVKIYLQVRERQAWQNYFVQEGFALIWTARLQTCRVRYWDFYDQYNGLVEAKAKLLAQFNPSMQAPVEQDSMFAQGAQLVVKLAVSRPPGATAPLDLAVNLAGQPAQGSGTWTYTIGSGSLVEGKKGLGLLVMAK